jgi:RNA polymerase sigma-70 factor, ECF subfamily
LAESPAAGEDRDERDDRTLLAAHVAGEPEAFGILFRRHRDRLWAVALRTTGDREEAADALQDAMVSAFRRAGSYRGDAAVTTWLHRIVVNACLDRLRRQKVRAADPLPDDLEEYAGRGALSTSTSGGRIAPDVADPAELVLDEERRAAVLDALGSLTSDQRAALVLVDMHGCSTEEAAAILGCAPGTVKSRCSRGRARLAPLLAGVHADVAEAGSGAAPRGAAAATTGEPRTAVERPSTGATGGGETP